MTHQGKIVENVINVLADVVGNLPIFCCCTHGFAPIKPSAKLAPKVLLKPVQQIPLIKPQVKKPLNKYPIFH